MRFLVDQQLSGRLCRMIEASGHACVHVKRAGLNGAGDGDIWARAVADAQ